MTERKAGHPDRWDADKAWRERGLFTAEQVGLRDVDGSSVAPRWNYEFDGGQVSLGYASSGVLDF